VIRLSKTRSGEKKVLVIGLDGANLDLIKLWSREGKLPAFKKLLQGGSYGYLESVSPTLTIPAWNCLASGKNSGKIGCFSFVQKAHRSYDFRLYSSLVKKETCIWDSLSDCGKENFVLNAPNVQSAYKINGYIVAGCLCTSEEKLTYPRSLLKELQNLKYEKDIDDPNILLTLNDSDLSKKYKEITEKQCKVLFHFIEKDWDFGFFVLNELDRIQHRFWNQKNLLLSHYQNIDRKLNEILIKLERKDEKINIIIVSDHGFTFNNKSFFVNEWLAKQGYLKLKRAKAHKFLQTLILIVRKPFIIKILRSMSIIPPLKYLYLRLYLHSGKISILWDKTKAFSYATWGTIYLNVRGREPQGIVKEEEYEQVRSKIIEELKEISVKAFRREEIYEGEYLELAPDIVIQIDNNVNSISGKVGYGKIFLKGFNGVHHRTNGTFIAWGPNIRKNFEMNAKLYDVTPTILHMFGVPIPKDMDGRVLKEIFKGELAMREIRYEDFEENKKIIKRIKELKYSGKI
jgi:predicted AlkP superfamily phosphohydrolase/phosphomutase